MFRKMLAAKALYGALEQILNETMYRDHPYASQRAIDALKKAGWKP